MKICFKYIFGLLGIVTMMSSCTEEKTYMVDSFFSGTVDFEIENMQLGDRSIARSVADVGSYHPVGSGTTFDIPVYYVGKPDEYYFSYSSTGENVVLSGGNNELQLRFTPRCPEETSAHFTMPWGKEYDLTAKDSVLNILIDRSMMQQPMDYSLVENGYYVIKAESEYKKGSVVYLNSGYVMIQLIEDLEYVKSEEKWYINSWMWNVRNLKGTSAPTGDRQVLTDIYKD